jgi:signal transduction histidine kinase
MICWYWILKLKARFLAGDYVEALAAADRAKALLWASPAHVQLLDYFYYNALTVAAVYENASVDEQTRWRDLLNAHREQLREWADNYPPTFSDKHALVLAEIARLEARELDAERLYEQAIQSARDNGFVQNEGLAHELAARFYAARGFEKIAHAYLQDARHCYLRWGALGKVRQLDQRYPRVGEQSAPSAPTAMIGTSVELDIGAVVAASQAVSGEIVLGRLIETLMTLALEHAGAERGLLILLRGDALQIEAEATTGRDKITVRLLETPPAPAQVSDSVLQYVMRMRESVILDDASAQNPFSADEYIRQKHPRSLLCLPLVKQAKLIGLLYLENNLASHVFTPARVSVLKLLSSQAAISLENARLYEAEQALHRAQTELARIARVTTLGELAASIAHEINQPLAAIVADANACLNWLGADRPDLDNVREALAAIVSDGDRAAQVVIRIRALLARSSVEREPCDLARVIGDVAVLVGPELRRHGIVLKTMLKAELPRVMGDRIQLQQVVLNLLVNAIEAMREVAPERRRLIARSSVEQRDDGPMAVVAVEDAGVGLRDSQTRLFEAFYTTKPGGLGMGLSISRSIIERHGGRLWATANQEHGATFHFALPGIG